MWGMGCHLGCGTLRVAPIDDAYMTLLDVLGHKCFFEDSQLCVRSTRVVVIKHFIIKLISAIWDITFVWHISMVNVTVVKLNLLLVSQTSTVFLLVWFYDISSFVMGLL